MLGLAVALKPTGESIRGGEVVLLVIASLLLVLDVGLVVRDHRRRAHRTRRFSKGKRQKEAIRSFMTTWVEEGDRVALFSRDLSWVDEAVEDALKRKAERGELTLVLPRLTDLARDLQARGAEVITYPSLDYTLQSRFTIAQVGRPGAQVAVGRAEKGDHVVEIFHSDKDLGFYLAADLLELIRRVRS